MTDVEALHVFLKNLAASAAPSDAEKHKYIHLLSEILHSSDAFVHILEQRILDFTRTISLLAKTEPVKNGDYLDCIRLVNETIGETLRVNRVLYWVKHEVENKLICLDMFSNETKKHESGNEYFLDDHVDYLVKLSRDFYIDSESLIEQEEKTKNHIQYYIPNQITACLDVPVMYNAELLGILSIEQQYTKRKWTAVDISFLHSIGEIITLTYHMQKFKTAQQTIEKQKNQLEQSRLQLENEVRQRTASLLIKNSELRVYANHNAHIIRGSVARILGLGNLIEIEKNDVEKNRYLSLLLQETNKLDSELHTITKKLHEAEDS